MRSIFVIDRDMARRELAHIRTILIGLVDSGVQTVLAMPTDMCHEQQELPGVTVIGYRDRGTPWTRSLRSRDLVSKLALDTTETTVVHGLGGRSQMMAAEIAHQLGAPLILDVHSRESIPRAVGVARERSGECLLLTPSARLARALTAAGAAPASVRELAWGVMKNDHAAERERVQDGSERSVGIVLSGSGNSKESWEAALRGLAQVASRREDFVILADADAMGNAGGGALVSMLGLSPMLSRVPKLEANRQVVLMADILVCPDAEGEHRSIVLDAMAGGMVVVATEDCDVPVLCDPKIAKLVSGEASEWASVLEAIIDQPTQRREMGELALAHVAEHYRASRYIAGLVDAYGWMLGNDSIPMSGELS